MIPQIGQRKIGSVVIVDIKGPLSGSWALRGQGRLSQMLEAARDEKVVLNLRGVTGIDTLGAKSLFESVSSEKEAGVVYGNSGVRDFINRFPESKRFRMFRDEAEIISVLGQDLVSGVNSKEQRTSLRMQTALPLEFEYEKEGEKIRFRAIITNLSEGGLFAEYIDLKIAEESLNQLNPYDLKILDLKLLFPNKKPIHVKGKVVYRKLDGEQVGIGLQFIQIGTKEQQEIRRFLRLHSFQKEMLTHSSQERKGL